VKIVDFGLAKVAEQTQLTKTGSRLGTVAYMSPEQARGEAVDHRTDVWSLGVVLYEMLTGERPFRGDYEQAVIYSILNQDLEPVTALHPEVPEALAAVVHRALVKEPHARYATIQDFARAVQQARAAGDEAGSEPVVASAMQKSTWDDKHQTLLAEGERVQATLVVSNLAGYIELVEALPHDEVERVVQRIRERATEIVHRHGGVINGFSDEEIVVLFGIPVPREDDFVRAVRMAWDLHADVRNLSIEIERLTDREIRLQTGLDTGLVVARQKDQESQPYHITGSTLQVATQLALRAEPDEILVSPASRRLIACFFETEASEPLRLKGQRQPVTPYRVVGISGTQTRLEAAEQAGLTTFTGRAKELHTLERCLEGALQGEGQFVTIAGDAGLGKSRLLYELRQGLDEAEVTLIQGRCQSYGENVPFLPFIETLRHHLQVGEDAQPGSPDEALAARIREIDPELEDFIPLYLHVLSIQSETYPLPKHLEGEYLRLAMLEGLAALFTQSTRHRPVVLLLEDWHWSDEASQEVLNQLAEMASAYSLLLVVTFRPVYAGAWSNPANHTPIHLKPLTATCSVAMMEAIFDVEHVPQVLGDLLSERAGGNPFFLEEICQTLREEGTVRVDSERVILSRSIEQFHLPDTVEAVIRTRLHRMDRHAQSVLRLASVVGREFSRGVLQHVLSEDAALLPSLEVLRAARLIQQTRVLPETMYRFKHALTQEVAYESLLKHQRKVLHGRVAEAIEALYPDRIEEQTDLLAHHFSQAEDWRQAVYYGHIAAKKAQRLFQFTEALAMLENARAWLMKLPESEARQETLVEMLLQQERICEMIGLRVRQQHIIDELFTLLEPAGDRARLAEVYLRQGDVYTLLQRYDAAEEALNMSLQLSRDLSDPVGEHNALRSM
ncbi:MAG: AAA family ATPase, partial [Acidobacteriota bacterium]